MQWFIQTIYFSVFVYYYTPQSNIRRTLWLKSKKKKREERTEKMEWRMEETKISRYKGKRELHDTKRTQNWIAV